MELTDILTPNGKPLFKRNNHIISLNTVNPVSSANNWVFESRSASLASFGDSYNLNTIKAVKDTFYFMYIASTEIMSLKTFAQLYTIETIISKLRPENNNTFSLDVIYAVNHNRKQRGFTLAKLKEISRMQWKLCLINGHKLAVPYFYTYVSSSGTVPNQHLSTLLYIENTYHDLCSLVDNDSGIREAPCEILSYSTRVNAFFEMPQTKNVLFGVELELTGVNTSRLRHAHDLLKQHCIFKRDGSIGDNGVEIVSKPATTIQHKKVFVPFLDSEHGLKATSSCGMHVHASRKHLSFLQIARIVEFLNKEDNLNFVSSIAGRSPNSYCRVNKENNINSIAASFNYGNIHTGERYSALNLQNRDTIEFRLFASTTNSKEFMSRLEFVNALINYTQPGALALPLKEQTLYTSFINWMSTTPIRKSFPSLYSFIKA